MAVRFCLIGIARGRCRRTISSAEIPLYPMIEDEAVGFLALLMLKATANRSFE